MSQTNAEMKAEIEEMYREVPECWTDEYKRPIKSFSDCDPTDNPTHEAFSIKPHGIEHNEAYDKCMNIVESIQSERENDYGDAGQSFDNIADFWNVYLSRKMGIEIFDLDRIDVANMLELMKMSRFAYQRKHDSALDKAAYADFALKFMEEHETKANAR